MSVTVRLAKLGKKHAPTFKIVVSNTRDKRNGKFLDVLGYYNPSTNPVEFKMDGKRYEEWKSKGALTTKAVEKLVNGTYKFVKYEPNVKEETETNEEGETTSEPTEEESSDSEA